MELPEPLALEAPVELWPLMLPELGLLELWPLMEPELLDGMLLWLPLEEGLLEDGLVED